MPKSKKSASLGRMTSHGFVSADVEEPPPEYVIAELRYEAPVAFTGAKFAAAAAGKDQAEALNAVLARHSVAALRPHFPVGRAAVRERAAVAAALPPGASTKAVANKADDLSEFIQSGFVQVIPKKGESPAKLAAALAKAKSVWNAYVAPRPVPAAVATGASAASRNFEPAQGYLCAAPNGIGAASIWDLAGGRGQGITVCDIEGNWNRSHEDLPSGIPLLGGTVINDIGWRNHGTAVLGEMVSIPSIQGTAGICHRAKAAVHSAIIGGVFNTAGAIAGAAAALSKGDVILIELQATGPNGKYVAMQYWDDVFSAIRVATDKGITVVEAAGNGDENFQLAVFQNTGLQKDSGAIVVGAGVPPTNHVDFDGFPGVYPPYASLGVPRSRLWFSNYGKIVNVQGWGYHVTTLGYGDAQGGASENRWYTLRFSGTSSASPIVTGAVACLQGRSKAKNGSPLTPAKVRKILMTTGTPQQAGPGVPLTQRIGPLPDLPEAMKLV